MSGGDPRTSRISWAFSTPRRHIDKERAVKTKRMLAAVKPHPLNPAGRVPSLSQ
jgi:hypothetical protein